MAKHSAPEPVPSPELVQEIRADHLSADVEVGLGRAAVDQEFDLENPPYVVESNNETVFRTDVKQELDNARNRLQSLSKEEKQEMNAVFWSPGRSPWLEDTIGARKKFHHRHVPDIISAVTRKDKDGKYVVDDKTFLNFLEWHNFDIAQTSRKFERRERLDAQRFRQDIEEAHAKGWITDSAIRNLSRLDRTRIVVDDGFATDAVHKEAELTPLHDDTYELRLSPIAADHPEVITHELGHVLEGEDDFPTVDPNQKIKPLEAKGMERIFGAGAGGTAINEGLDEQFAHSLKRGHIDEINPRGKTRRTDARYVDQRQLLYMLAEKGIRKVNIRTFLAAQHENGDEAAALGDSSARNTLIRELQAAHPYMDVVAELSGAKDTYSFMKELEKRGRKYKQMQRRLAGLAIHEEEPG